MATPLTLVTALFAALAESAVTLAALVVVTALVAWILIAPPLANWVALKLPVELLVGATVKLIAA